MKLKVLIVEDQFIEANNLRLILDRAGYQVIPIAASFVEGMEMLERHHPDLVLLDIYLDGSLTGIDLAKVLNARKIPFVYLSANSNRKVFVAAKATKPYGFLVKPFRHRDVLAALEVALELHGVMQQVALRLQEPLTSSSRDREQSTLLTQSPAMRSVLDHVRLAGPSETTILLTGESGTGKEVIARAVHAASLRRKQPLVIVNCGALPATLVESELFGHEKGAFTGAQEKKIGQFERAEGGTIFLDEIGELPIELQVKFLRVLQQKEIQPIGGNVKRIDVRIIAATNRQLDEEVAAGRFRMDLYYRLNVFPIILPPLRERKEDIAMLAQHFLEQFSDLERKIITGFTPQVLQALQAYDWPGNVRELENVIHRIVLLTKGAIVNEFHYQAPAVTLRSADTPLKSMADTERDHIIAILKSCNWKVYGPGGAAEKLDMHVSTLNSRMKKLGIEKHGLK